MTRTDVPRTVEAAHRAYADPDLDLWVSATLRCETCDGVYFDAPGGAADRILASGGTCARHCPYCEGPEPAHETRYDARRR